MEVKRVFEALMSSKGDVAKGNLCLRYSVSDPCAVHASFEAGEEFVVDRSLFVRALTDYGAFGEGAVLLKREDKKFVILKKLKSGDKEKIITHLSDVSLFIRDTVMKVPMGMEKYEVEEILPEQN